MLFSSNEGDISFLVSSLTDFDHCPSCVFWIKEANPTVGSLSREAPDHSQSPIDQGGESSVKIPYLESNVLDSLVPAQGYLIDSWNGAGEVEELNVDPSNIEKGCLEPDTLDLLEFQAGEPKSFCELMNSFIYVFNNDSDVINFVQHMIIRNVWQKLT